MKIAIVGATGLVGRTVMKVLEEMNLPISEYVLFASSNSAGKKVKFMNKEYIVQDLKRILVTHSYFYQSFLDLYCS